MQLLLCTCTINIVARAKACSHLSFTGLSLLRAFLNSGEDVQSGEDRRSLKRSVDPGPTKSGRDDPGRMVGSVGFCRGRS